MVDMKIAHLGFIQGIINRMANNSFLIKGWCITLVAAVLSLSQKDSDKSYFLVAYVPIFLFWAMDAYFFHQEHLYRKLYWHVASDNKKIDVFSLNASFLKKDINHIACYPFKMAVFPVYVVLGAVLLLVIMDCIKIK